MNAILIALLVALGLLIVISAYVSALCARGSRERYSLRVRDENEMGWMDARGDLYREMCARRRARVGRALMAMAGVSLLALLILLSTRAAGEGVTLPAPDPAALRDLRVRKCRVIVDALYPGSGFGPHVEHFIDEHERMGIGDEWQWSLAYGGSNFSLRVGGRAPGRCYGPMDVKGPVPASWRPTHLYTGAWSDSRLLDPRINISVHVAEAAYHHRRTGRTGYRLMQAVFLPSAPRDWGANRDRIRKAYQRHVQTIEAAYRDGRLP